MQFAVLIVLCSFDGEKLLSLVEVRGLCKAHCDFTDFLRLNSFLFHVHVLWIVRSRCSASGLELPVFV